MKSIPASEKYFGDTASQYDEKRQGREAFHADQLVLRSLLSEFVGAKTKVLDVACGTNRISEIVAQLGGVYHGIDVSSDMVALARKKAPDADIRVADARAIPHDDARFDVIVTVKFLKWVPDDDALRDVLREVARVLRPGGVALFHQKIRTGAAQALSNTLRRTYRNVLRQARGSGKSGARTRAVDNDVFTGMCREQGLAPRYAVLPSGADFSMHEDSINLFHVMERTS